MGLEKKWEEDRRTAAATLDKMDKQRKDDRKEDQIVMVRLVTDVQRRIASALAHTVAEVMDKQTVVHQITMTLSDLRSEKTALTTQIAIFTGDPSKQQAIQALLSDRAEVCGRINAYEAELKSALAQRITLPQLEDPTESILKLQAVDDASGKVSSGRVPKRKPTNVVHLAAIPHQPTMELYEAALVEDPDHVVCPRPFGMIMSKT